ncbi:MAG: hypothetical protein ACFE0S_01105 [Rhodospirillales bacterium]
MFRLFVTMAFAAATIALVPGTDTAKAAAPGAPKYDGVYRGHVDPSYRNRDMDCETPEIPALRIRNGRLEQPPESKHRITGFVTHDGFVMSRFNFAGAGEGRMEGRIQDDRLVGGLSGPKGDCAWIVTLSKVASPET